LGLLSDEDVDWLSVVGWRQTLQSGEVLIRDGTEPRGLYFVLSGRLEVLNAAQQTLDTIERGELAGEVSFVDRLPATATVLAAEETLLFAIDRTQLLLKIDRDSGFAARFYRSLAAVLAARFRSATGDSHNTPETQPQRINPHLATARFQRLLARMAHRADALVLSGNDLTIFDVARVASHQSVPVEVSPLARERMARSRDVVERAANDTDPVYGLNTGLGALKDLRIPPRDMHAFQRNILMSHATGIGPEFSSPEVRAIMLVRLNGMCRGGSGVQLAVFDQLLAMLNAGVHPVVPSRGSTGMSDLAALAHMALPLIGLGEVEYGGRRMSATSAMNLTSLQPVELGPKDGLALCSANSASVGHGALVVNRALDLLACADVAAALSLEAFQGHAAPLDERTHTVRPYTGEIASAARIRQLMHGSSFWRRTKPPTVQDPLSLRCIPQVHGACLDALAFVRETVEIELNGTGDNPVVLIDEQAIVSNGNFHSAGMAIAFDTLAIVLAQLSGLATSRVLRLLDPQLTGLPPALVTRPGVSTGFNVLAKTLTALNAENRYLGAPASLDFQPVAGEIEDHATNAAMCVRKAATIEDNCQIMLAIEVLVAAQAISLRRDIALGDGTRAVFDLVRQRVPFVEEDTIMAPLLDAIIQLVCSGELLGAVRDLIEARAR
jgi:histidine ammonia-lyase